MPSRSKKLFLWEPLEPRLLLSADSVGAILGDGTVHSLLDRDPHDGLNSTADLQALIDHLDRSEQSYTSVNDTRTALPNAIDLNLLSASSNEDDLFTLLAEPMASDIDAPLEFVFVDRRAPDYQQLLDDLENNSEDRNLEIVLLDADRDGIQQISEMLDDYESVDAIHIISHGDDGLVQLGSSWLSLDSLATYQASITGWSEFLSGDADLLIYGCNLAASEAGQALIQALSEFTGADVAASDDTTGHAALGGNWTLEFATGVIESNIAISESLQQNWLGALPVGFTATSEILVHAIDLGNPQETSSENRGSQHAVDNDSNGNYVVVWSSLNQDGSGWGVFGQRYDASGVAQGSLIQINETTNDNQRWASVAMADDGKFTVTWTSENQDGTASSIYARQFTSGGTAVAGEFRVNTENTGSQSNSTLAMDAAGNFTIVWQGNGSGDSDGIFYRRFDNGGLAIDATDQLANQTNTTAEHDPVIAMQTNGKFVIAWDEGKNIFLQRFDAAGTLGVQTQIDGGASTSSGLAIDSDANGNFTVVYREEAFLTGIWHRGYNEDGTEKYGYDRLATDDAISPSIRMDDVGNHVVVYHKTGDGNGFGVYSEAYDSTGTSLGSAVQINTTTTGNQQFSSVALLDTNNYVVVWSGEGATDSNGVYARQVGTGATAANAAPTANAGGPYTINEGDSLNLDASASTDPETDPLTYEWDLSYDNSTFNTEATGETPNLNWAALQSVSVDDDGTYTVAVRADDGQGNVTIDTSTLTIINTAPILSATGANTVANGALYTLNLSASDPGDDTISNWTINWGDGSIETIPGNPSTVTHTYTNLGFTNNITVSATDEDNPDHYIHNDLFVGHYANDAGVYRVQGDWGNPPAEFATEGTLDKTIHPVVGPDGYLYVSGESSKNVLRYHADTGVFFDEFVTSGSGGIVEASGIAFGPTGNLYVSDFVSNSIKEYDASNGAYLGDFVGSGSGTLSQPYSLAFGPSGDLYVGSYNQSTVFRFDGSTGAPIDSGHPDSIGIFIPSAQNGNLGTPEQITFGPDGNLYVTDDTNSNVLRFDGATGIFINKFILDNAGGLSAPNGMAFGPDGHLYVSGFTNGTVLRYDGSSGNFIDEYATGLNNATFLTFAPDLQVTVNAVANVAPTADAGGPYAINEGDTLNLNASASTDPETDPLTYEWDLSYDGITFNAEATGETPILSWAALQAEGIDDDGTYTIAVRTDDGQGNTDIDQVTLTVDNTVPTLTATGAANVVDGAVYTLNLSAIDPGSETIANWIINWGDGTIDTIAGNPSSATHTYTGVGLSYNITASVTDEDGTFFQNELLITGESSNHILRIDPVTGASLQEFGAADGLTGHGAMLIGPDGLLYVGGDSSNVLRYNPQTGVFIDTFIPIGSGGLNIVDGLAFGPNGNLFVSSSSSGEVLQYDGTTGASLGVFSSVNGAQSLAFGPDGNLYVTSTSSNNIQRFDGVTGAFIDNFVVAGTSGLNLPIDLLFHSDGNLYVTSLLSNSVLRFDATTGAFVNEFVTSGAGGLSIPVGMTFGPDGHLYVGAFSSNNVLRFDGSSGVFIDEYVTAGTGGLSGANYPVFIPNQQVNVTASNLAPTITSSTTPNIDENQTIVQTLSATDPEFDTVTFTITGGNDNGLFSINGSDQLIFTNAPDFESPIDTDTDNVYEVEITANDGNSGTDIQLISVTVNATNDNAPVITSPATANVVENTTVVHQVTATDADLPGDTLTFGVAGSGADDDAIQYRCFRQSTFHRPARF